MPDCAEKASLIDLFQQRQLAGDVIHDAAAVIADVELASALAPALLTQHLAERQFRGEVTLIAPRPVPNVIQRPAFPHDMRHLLVGKSDSAEGFWKLGAQHRAEHTTEVHYPLVESVMLR